MVQDEFHSEESADTTSDRNTSRSRRGFLRKTVATSILGMTGMTATVKVASATEDTEQAQAPASPQQTSAVDTAQFDNHVTFIGRSGGDYLIGTTQPIAAGGLADSGDDIGNYYAEGHVNILGRDDYYFDGSIRFLEMDNGVHMYR